MNLLRTLYVCILFAIARFGVSAETWDKAKGRMAKKLEPERYHEIRLLASPPPTPRYTGNGDVLGTRQSRHRPRRP
jgi:hypothetical protein